MKKGNYDEMRLGAITFLDVLGWKGIWRSKPDACQKLIEIIKSAIKIEADHQKTLSNLEHLKELKNLDTGLLSISDTIVIYTYGDSYFSLLMHGIICAWIIPHSIFEGIPFRGATNYGEFQIEGNILVGPAIDEVASWYEFGEWVGVMLTPSALLTTNLSNFYGGKEQKASFNDYFCKYNAPIKKGKFF